MSGRRTESVLLTVALLALACGGEALEVRTVSEYNSGKGMAGVRVQVNDLPWVETDAEGRASFDDVEPPYTLRVFQQLRFDRAANALFEATVVTNVDVWTLIEQTANPLVFTVDEGPTLGDPEKCEISGTIAGAAGMVPSMATGIVSGGGQGGWDVTADAFSIELPRLETDVLSLRALTITPGEDPDGFPAGYTSAGAADVPVDGACGKIEDIRLALEPVATDMWQPRYEVPEGVPANRIRARAGVAFEDVPHTEIYLGDQELMARSGTFDLLVPRFGAPAVAVSADGDDGRVVEEASEPTKYWERFEVYGSASTIFQKASSGESNPLLVLATPVQLLTPEDGAALGPGTVFSWTPASDGALYEFHLGCRPPAPTGNVNVRSLQTRGTEITVPDFVVVDALESGMRCGWTVRIVDKTATESRIAAPAERFLRID